MSSDVKDTREKILLSGCRCFSENGFEGVTHRELAKDADVNSALINYHFNSKEQLFEEVLDYSYQLSISKYPLPENREMDSIEGIISIARSRLLSVFDDGPEGWFPRIVFHEMHSYTARKDLIRKRYFSPVRMQLTHFVAEYFQMDINSQAVITAVFNISSQWIMMNVARSRGLGMFKDKVLTEKDKSEIIRRVIEFIKGGLEALKV
jgi:AcrR family transcriptional regulator